MWPAAAPEWAVIECQSLIDAGSLVSPGMLADPLYFDFISFAQNATIAQEMPRGRAVFEEFCEECPDNKRLVRRDASISNDALPAAYFEAVGDKIYDGLRHGFRVRTPEHPAVHACRYVWYLLRCIISRLIPGLLL